MGRTFKPGWRNRVLRCCLFFSLAFPLLLNPPLWAQKYRDENGKLRVSLVKMPYRGARNVPELSEVPDYLEAGGLADLLSEGMGVNLRPTASVSLTAEEQRDYGVWHRLGLANGHLARIARQ